MAPSATRMVDPTLLSPEWQGSLAPQERRKAMASRCYQQSFALEKPERPQLSRCLAVHLIRPSA